jgi:hypothetical protein
MPGTNSEIHLRITIAANITNKKATMDAAWIARSFDLDRASAGVAVKRS